MQSHHIFTQSDWAALETSTWPNTKSIQRKI